MRLRFLGLPALIAGGVVAVMLGAFGADGAAGQDYRLPTTTTAPAVTLPQLEPFPVVRVVGRATRRGAIFSRVTVRARVGSAILVSCTRTACPYRSRSKVITGKANSTRTVRFYALERSFRAGATLRMYVAKASFTGKYTSLGIRRRKPPRRLDRCVSGLNPKPVSCAGG